MKYALLKLALLITVAFTAPMLFIHGQSYDDSELRTFLSPPEHCPSPCFMGIRAGITRVRDGKSFLQASAQVESIRAISFQLYEVQFSKSAPTRAARVYFMALPDVTVERVNLFDSGLAFNRFFLTFGTPQRMVVYRTLRPTVVSLVVFYPQNGLAVVTNFSLCDLRQSMLWSDRRDVAIDVGFWRADTEQPDYYLAATELNIKTWAKQLRDMRQERCP